LTTLGKTRRARLPDGQHTPLDDAALFKDWLDGRPYAARIMWQRFAPMVHRILKRSLGSDASLEDLEQEVFLSLFQHARLLREPKALKSFIISITVRTLHSEIRRRWLGRTRRWQLATAAPNRLAVYPDPESREGLRQFFFILDRVNGHDRRAFVLHFLEGVALEEIAAALDVSLATVKRRLSRVRKRVVRMARRDNALVDYLPDANKSGARA